MDKHIAHNIIHRAHNASSADCPICNGSKKLEEAPTLASQIIEQQEERRLQMMKNECASPAFYKEAEKTVKSFSESHIIDVLKFSEGDKLPKKIHLIPLGKWNTVKYGEIEITKDMLTQMSENFKNNLRAGNEAPIDIEHGDSQYKDAAAGWIKDVSVETDGLWASELEWTDLGADLIKKKIYKYASPEFHFKYIDPLNADEVIPNVFIALSLVNRPLFRILKPLTAGEGNLTDGKLPFILSSEPMNTKTILNKKAEELSAEEREFLKVHASELTEEQKKAYGLLASEEPAKDEPKAPEKDNTPPKDEAITAGEETKTIKASEYDELVKFREESSRLKKEAQEKAATEEIESLCFSETGVKLKSESKGQVVGFYLSLNETQRKQFSEIVKEMPEAKIFGEKGSDRDNKITDKRAALDIRATELMKEKKIEYREAVNLAVAENPELGKSDTQES